MIRGLMADIVGVHGIAQQQKGRNQLLGVWAPALADGVEFAVGHPVSLSFDLAFYGNIFLPAPPAATQTEKGAADVLPGDLGTGPGDLASEDAAEKAFLQAATEEAVATLGLDKGTPDEETKGRSEGIGPAPLWLQWAARRLDARLGAGASALFVGQLRQVHRYLTERRVADAVLTQVTDTAGDGCRVLLGHSLGSVVAYEAVRRLPGPLDLLVTLGSPLGLRSVRDRLSHPDPEPATGLPPGVQRWVNVYDRRDPVACAGGLGSSWPGVEDVLVDNEEKPHAVERYLSKQQTGQAVYDTLASAR
jgi:hypothetical protein